MTATDALRSPPIDTLRTTETPEGVQVGLRLAGVPVRFAAWLADTFIRYGALSPVASLLLIFGNAGMGLFMIVAFLAEWFYPVVCEVYWNGQTPGKRMFGLRVVRDDGAAVDWSASTLRNMLRFADFLPLGFLFGALSILVTDESKRLGDLAAGTVVVHVPVLKQSLGARTLPSVTPAMPPLHLAQAEQVALIDFAERSQLWTDDRQIELADSLEPLTGEFGEPGVRTLHSYALWLLGRR